MQQKIIILDFGSQTTQLIGRRVRELDTFCEILPYNKFPKNDDSIIGVILLSLIHIYSFPSMIYLNVFISYISILVDWREIMNCD